MNVDALMRRPHGSERSWIRRGRGLLAGLLLFFVSLPAFSLSSELEAKVKAAYVYHFIQFVDWPQGEGETTPIRIGVVGSDPVGPYLEELEGRQVRGRSLQVEQVGRNSRKLASFHILFVSRSMQAQLPQILQQIQGSAVLTVSDIDQFSQKGGMIGFYPEGGKIRIEISMTAVRPSNLKLGARLLEVARVIQ